MADQLMGFVVEVGSFRWGRGAMVRTATGKIRVVAGEETTKAMASRLYKLVTVVGEQRKGSFLASEVVETGK